METNINIAAILKDKPEGTKLWTDMFGSVTLYVVTDACDAFQVKHHNKEPWFDKEGKLCKEGVLCIYPSKSMRDWSKFAWKRCDVLVSNDGGTEVIFDKWYDDTYTSFYCKHYLNSEDENNIVYHEAFLCTTERYSLEDKDTTMTYINTLEERLGGKLNRETLEIEKAQPKFKDGDIIYAESDAYHYPSIHILNTNCDTRRYYARLVINGSYDEVIDYDISAFDDAAPDRLRFATEEERQQLFKALANEGKAWDAEKKMIVGLKSLWTPKPFDKVLVRNSDADKWLAGFFEKFEKSWNNPYHIMNLHHMTDFAFKQCIPYEGNESLLGTTKDVEG